MKEFSDNAWDIGLVSGVLRGILCTPSLAPHEKEAIQDAIKATDRIQERNQCQVVDVSCGEGGCGMSPTVCPECGVFSGHIYGCKRDAFPASVPKPAPAQPYNPTRLDYFAAKAMAGYCANPDYDTLTSEQVASWSVTLAKATIAAIDAVKKEDDL